MASSVAHRLAAQRRPGGRGGAAEHDRHIGPLGGLADHLVQHLLHLWLPGRRHDLAREWWEQVERRDALSDQWKLLRDRIRDLVALAAVDARSDKTEPAR